VKRSNVFLIIVGLALSLDAAAQSVDLTLSLVARTTDNTTLTKSAPGQDVVYLANVQNNSSTTAATGTALTDDLPAGVTFRSVTAPAGWTCTGPQAGTRGRVSCTNPSLAPASGPNFIRITVRVDLNAPIGGTIANTASVSSTTPEATPADNTASASFLVTSSDLAISIADSPETFTPGANVTYVATVINLGGGIANDLRLESFTPASTTFVSATPSAGGSCTKPAVGAPRSSLNCTWPGPTGSGTRSTLTLVVKVDASVAAGTRISYTASVDSSDPDPNRANNSATGGGNAVAAGGAAADLSITATGPAAVEQSKPATYEISAANAGPATGNGTILFADIPAGTSFVSLIAAGGACSAPVPGAFGTLFCRFGDLASGASARMLLTIVPVGNAVAPVRLDAVASAQDPDPNAANNLASVTTQITSTSCGSAPQVERLVPIVLDVTTPATRYSTELALSNRGPVSTTLFIRYTPALGEKAGGGSVSDVLLAGQQLVIPDVLAYLRGKGLAIPPSDQSPQQGGTLVVRFENIFDPSAVAVTARTTAATASPQPLGAAGLAYAGIDPCEGARDRVLVFGIRTDASDRTNLAVFNTERRELTFKVTIVSGDGSGKTAVVRASETIDGFGWIQLNRVLDGTGIDQGYAVIERLSSTGAIGAYGVINDNFTNDGSFVLASSGPLSGTNLTLPVLVEVGSPRYRSELVLANKGTAEATLTIRYVESLSPAGGAGGSTTVRIGPGRQLILPDAVAELRREVGISIGNEDAASYAGALSISVQGVPLSDIYVGARTAAQSPLAGQFGLFTPGVPSGFESFSEAFIFGLQANATTRSNVAVANAATSGASITLELQAFDGDAGGAAKGAPKSFTLSPGQWAQEGNFLKSSGVSNGWVRVRRLSGGSQWIAYGVINDGGTPGDRTGDGAFVPTAR